MAEAIKQEIINNIYENGEQLITGPVLQEVLLDMVDDYNDKISSGSVPQEMVEKTGSWDDAADWVEDNSGSLVHDTDLDGYATEQWVEDQGYLKELPEGLATTESVNQVSESVAALSESVASIDLSGYATTQSVNEATESTKEWVVAQHYLTTASLSGSVTEETVGFMINDATASVKEWVESQSYATETFVSASIADINIPSTEGFVTTESYNQDSASFDERINAITGSDLSGYATTESLNQLSESLSAEIPDVSGLATTESVNSLSESVASDITSLSESIAAITGSDLSGYATTESLNRVSESVATSIEDLEGSVISLEQDLENRVDWDTYDADRAEFSQSVAGDIADLSASIAAISGSDLSGYATTQSVNNLSQSVAADITNLSESIAAITGSDLSGYVTTQSYNQDSASFDQRIDAIVVPDLSEYATTSSVNSLSESVAQDFANLDIPDISGLATTQSVNNLSSSINNTFNQYATTQSVTQLSQSISQSISQISGSGADLSTLADPTDENNPVFIALESASIARWDDDYSTWVIDMPTSGELDGECGSFWDLDRHVSPLQMALLEAGIWKVDFDYDENEDKTYWQITYDALSDTEWGDNKVMQALQNMGLANWMEDPEVSETGWWELVFNPWGVASLFEQHILYQDIYGNWHLDPIGYVTTASYNQDSASFDQRINSITGSDLSGYATTASVNALSSSVNNISASFVTTINNLSASVGPWEPGEGTSSAQLPGNSARGYKAVAAGEASEAIGNYSQADGYRVKALARSSHAEGEDTSAGGMEGNLGRGAHAEGVLTIAGYGQGAHAEGEKTRAWNDGTHAEGYQTTANMNYAHAEGYMTFANNLASHAEGSGSKGGDSGFYVTPSDTNKFVASPIEEGGELPNFYSGYTFISNDDIFVVGTIENGNILNTGTTGSIVTRSLASRFNGPAALGRASHVEGTGTKATEWCEHAQGKYNATASNQIFSVGVGHDGDNRRNAISVITGSNDSASIYLQGVGGYDGTNPTPGTNDLASVIANLPTGSGGGSSDYLPITGGSLTGSLGIGYSQPSPSNSLAVAGKVAIGSNTFNNFDGDGTMWVGKSLAVGPGMTPRGRGCLAVGGSGTSTDGANFSVAVGENCQAKVYGAFVAGRENVVEGNGAFGTATGFRCRTIAMGGYAGGCRSTGSANFATAIGFGAEARALGQVVLGSYNEYDPTGGRQSTGSYAVIFGIGKSSTWNQDNPGTITRQNGLAIKWDGGIDINYSGSTITLQDKIAELEQGGGSSIDLSGYATTASVNALSASFDQRIEGIVAASGGIDPSAYAKAPSIIYATDGTYGLTGVNASSSVAGSTRVDWVISDQDWQLENLDLSNFDRIECYFKYSPKVVVLPLDSGTTNSSGYYVEKASSLDSDVKSGTSENALLSYFSRKWVVVDSTKTKLQVAVNNRSSDYLYKIVGYPKLV